MNIDEQIRRFLDGAPHAVAGASRDRSKYGNKVLRVYLQNDLPVYAVNPNAEIVEGQVAYPDLESLPKRVHGISVITPPDITESIVEQAARLGIKNLWLQPGSESEKAIQRGKEHGLNVIAGNACVLVSLGYHENDGNK